MTERWSYAANDVVEVDEAWEEGWAWLCPDCGHELAVEGGAAGCEECGWTE